MFDIIIKIIKKYPNLFYSQKVIYFIPPLNQFSSPNFPTPTIPTIGKYHAVLFIFFLYTLFRLVFELSVQFSHSVVCDSLRPMNRSMPGLPVHHQLPEFTQTHVH